MNSKNQTIDDLQNSMEKIIEQQHYKDFDTWIENFSLNLNDIWTEPSAHELNPSYNSNLKNSSSSAIVIGKGPSVKKHKHLELLVNSNYDGSIICTDGMLPTVLEAGITPERFPNFFVVTIDPDISTRQWYDKDIVDKFGKNIKGIFTTVSYPPTVIRARESGIKIHWIHSLFDYNEGIKSFNYISGKIVRSKNHNHGLPAIQTGGNVGTSSWFAAWKILQCKEIALIGINHGWEEDDPWDIIISHNKMLSTKDIDQNKPSFKKLFEKIYNPEFDCYFIYDPIFRFYSNALREFISRSPDWLTTINATEGGSIFGNRIICKKFSEFLNQNKGISKS